MNQHHFTEVDFNPFVQGELEKIFSPVESQQEIWTACVIGGADANRSYNESVSLFFRGKLRQAFLNASLQDIVSRHEALRATISEDGQSICIAREMDLQIHFEDLSGQTSLEQDQHIEHSGKQDMEMVFDLQNGPLLRVSLFKKSETDHILRITAHHLICDGWSFGVILEDLSKIYSAYVKDEHPVLEEAVPFSRYAAETAAYAQSSSYQQTEQYWINQYKDSVPRLDLPIDFPRPLHKTYKSRRDDFTLNPGLLTGIRQTGAKAGGSLVTTLITAFEIYLHQITGQQDIVLGVPASGQAAAGYDPLVGHCVHLLPMRSHPSAELSFTEYLRLRKVKIMDDYEHQRFTFGSLLKKINIARDSSRVPLVPVIFNVDMGMDAKVTFYGLEHRLFSNPRSYENFEIFLNATGSATSMELEWSYNTALFRPESIRQMMAGFEELLLKIVNNPDQKIRALTSRDTISKELPVSDFAALPLQENVWSLIDRMAAEKAEQTAICFRDNNISYSELKQKSDGLAGYLIQQGVQKGDIIGVALDRSPELIISLLGVMKAGAAYLPLDPEYPAERIDFMLGDSAAKFLLSDQKYEGMFRTGTKQLNIEMIWNDLSTYEGSVSDMALSGNDLAYVLYTSGSTGQPKGVMIEHHSLLNFLLSMQKKPGLSAEDTLLAVTTISFDIAGLEIYLPLITGAKIVLADTTAVKDGRLLLELIENQHISIIQATPSTWRMLIDAGLERGHRVKALCGGEAFPADLAESLLQLCSSVWNLYGPTETTIWSSLKQLKPGDTLITIGKAIDRTRIYILDESGQPAAPGISGEICIAGDGLARGYLNRPELTAEKFVPAPFSDAGSDKMYRTGDLGLYLENGEIQCMGRIDQQVKIRGYRIEPGEIEYQLVKQPGVKAAAVIAVKDEFDTQRLVAYIVPDEEETSFWHERWDELYTLGIKGEENLPLAEQDLDLSIISQYNADKDIRVHGEEWTNEGLKRIKAIQAKTILEIGAGAGHLIQELAPDMENYVATDYSHVAIEKLREKIAAEPEKWGHVEVLESAADDFNAIPDHQFDLVVMHSVIQYFPGIRYLLKVLTGACKIVPDGGCIFIGDVQSLNVIKMHLLSDQLSITDRHTSVDELKKITSYRIEKEEELSVDPDFFYSLPQIFPEIQSVDIQLRGGELSNEATKCHYDVWLYIGASSPKTILPSVSLTWEDHWSVSQVEQILVSRPGEVVEIKEIPNQRLSRDYAWLNAVNAANSGQTIREIQEIIHFKEGIQPVALWEAGQKTGNKAHVRWKGDGSDDKMEVVFIPAEKKASIPEKPDSLLIKGVKEHHYKDGQALNIPQVRDHQLQSWKEALKQVLPDYMVPAEYLFLDRLPTTNNGKIDRNNLPKPSYGQHIKEDQFIAPSTDTEKQIAKIWSEFLKIDDISVSSNFFELGGHSIIAVKVMLKLEKETGIRLPITTLFEHSTIEKLARATGLDQMNAPEPAETQAISANIEDTQISVPTTEPQREIWLACELGGIEAGKSFNLSFSQHFYGQFDTQAMQLAVQELVNRHESLRATFSTDGTRMLIHSQQNTELKFKDISAHTPGEQEAMIARYSAEYAEQVFSLTEGPLFKTTLLKLSEDHYYFTLTAHHIIFDGWSYGIAQQELAALYSAYRNQQQPTLAQAPLFSSYALNKQSYYQSKRYLENEQYWIDQMKIDLMPLELPLDFPRPKRRTYASSRMIFKVEDKVASGLKKIGAKANSSVAITLRAALEVFLYRLTGQEIMITGLPIAGQLMEDEHLMGHCVNVLPLRANINDQLSFSQYLEARKKEIINAYNYPDVTFGSILKKLSIGRGETHLPLISVVLNTGVWMEEGDSFAGITSEVVTDTKSYENFELSLDFTEYKDQMTLRWDYNKALFKRDTIYKLNQQFEYLISYVAIHPDALLSKVPLGNEKVLSQELDKWNNNYFSYNPKETVHSLISKTAKQYPDRIAVSFGETRLSYQTLNMQSSQLANLLLSKGIKSGDKIGIAIDRSADMISILLAVMKTGATYLPFDINHPKERIAYMLEDADARLLITHKRDNSYSGKVAEMYLEDMLAQRSAFQVSLPETGSSGNDLIYILHTSGSTGKPKGVQIRHNNVVNFLLGMQQTPGIHQNDRLLAITPISFDMAVLLYLPLICGAELVIADLESAKDGRLINDIILKKEISWMIATPATWKMTLASGWLEKRDLLAISAGEALSKDLAANMISRCRSVWNGYGPTETTVMVLMKEVTNLDEPITLGKPIINTQIYILDKHGSRVDIGVPGEIYIAGDGVGSGYLNLPEQTSKQFVPNPFSKGTMYKSGDLGKFLPNGDIQYLGRIDHQVKIRGHRIELEEIEQSLISYPDIRSAVVNPAGTSKENLILVAYIILKKGINAVDKSTILDWEIFLRNRLPDYMIPQEFIVVDTFPLTDNGKIDRKKLPMPEILNPGYSSGDYVAPRNSTEKMLAAIWEKALETEKISVNSDFFKSGGHSLIAVDIMLLVEQETGKRLPLSSLLENPTIERLARLIEGNEKDIKWNSLVPIKKNGSKKPVYMVHGSGLNVIVFNPLAEYMDKDQPVYGMQALGLNGSQKLLYTMEDLADYYNAEILNNDPEGPYMLAGYSFGGVLAYEMAKRLIKMGKEVKMLGILDTYVGGRGMNNSKLSRLARKTIRQFNKLFFFGKQFLKDPKEVYNYQHMIITDKIKQLTGVEMVDEHEAFAYHKEVNRSYEIAYDNYVMEPLDIEVDLFRVKKRLYFLDDPVFLGWKKFAKKGVRIHEVPGDHKTFLFPPHDKEFARIFQQALNEHQ